MRLDRKFFLIAPTLVLILLAVGMFYAASRLQVITAASYNWQQRSDFVASVERGERVVTTAQAVGVVRLALEAERRRTAAIVAARDLLLTLAAVLVGCSAVLLWAIGGVKRTVPVRSADLTAMLRAPEPEPEPIAAPPSAPTPAA